ncbi:unnamed protein product, partial [Rotaria sp. Silwood2]
IEEAITVATKHLNIYTDISAYTIQCYPRALIEYMKIHGRNKVLFGTNYTMITPAEVLDGLNDLGLDGKTHALLLG